ncbi:MAG TPA: hypothetical protein VM290_08660 [Gaiellaceae bacterium]|nr:hypothetical protein [Gaiellaceae bacterium]
MSLTETGGQSNGDSASAAVSGNGRYVAFASAATNLVAGDTNNAVDIFVRDRVAGTTRRVSVSSSGAQANANSREAAISADGSVVAFASQASNLVAGDTNGSSDIFVHVLATGVTTRVSVSSTGAEGNGNSFVPSLSGDGRYVAFWSHAGNLVGGADAPLTTDVFVHDRQTGTTELVSVSSAGAPAQVGGDSHIPSISDDGRYVAFQSLSTTFDAADTNGQRDIYVRDRQSGTTTRVSLSTGGAQGDLESFEPAISGDGSTVAYASRATTLVPNDTNGDPDVFATTLATGATERVSVSTGGGEGVGASGSVALSYDGRYVAFESMANNLVAGDTNGVADIFVRDRADQETTRESLTHLGLQTTLASHAPDVTGDGQLVSFHSLDAALVASDTNSRADVFVHQLGVADVTAPTVTGQPDRAPDANGWYNANVTITWSAVDPQPSAGPPTVPAPTVAATEGKNVPYTSGPSCDPNNNCATGTVTLSIDKTPPTVLATVTAPNQHGWYAHDVLVGFQCADSLSGIATCPAPQTLTTEGASLSASGTATDRAGNQATATATGIKIDKTPPTIAFSGPTTYAIDATVTITCTATDALSGIDTAVCPQVIAPAYLFSPGGHVVTAVATDKAGNVRTATHTFTITAPPGSIATLACQFAGNSGHGRAVCRKLERLLEDAHAALAANDTRRLEKAVKEFQQTAAKESGKLFTAHQVALLVRLAASLVP